MHEQNVLFTEQKLPFVGKMPEILPLLYESIRYATGAHLVSLFERIIIGVAGGVGAGKSMLADKIVQNLPEFNPTVIKMDRFYKDGKTSGDSQNSDSIDINLLKTTLSRIKDHDEQIIELPVYSIASGKQTSPETIHCGKLVILEGSFAIYPEFSSFLNMGIFIDALESIRFQRFITAEVQTKGKSYAAVQTYWNAVAIPAYFKYVAMQRKFANVIVLNNDT